MLLHFTGSGHFNRSLRSRADKMVCHTLCVCFDFSMSVGVFVCVLVCLSVCVFAGRVYTSLCLAVVLKYR